MDSDCPQRSLFEVRQVHFAYPGGDAVLDDISFDVLEGASIALMGANGCGKSTLLKVLDGLLFPMKGNIRFFGEELSEIALKSDNFNRWFRRNVGFIFQQSDIQLFSPTVEEEIAFGPLHLHLSPKQVKRRVEDISEMLEITHLLQRPPYLMSGGEKKKVALASVLSLNPSVLLLDEPSAGLDPRSQMWLVETLKKLHHAGKTIVIATHDLDIVDDIADTVVIFNEKHRIEKIGPAKETLKNTEMLLQVNLIHEHYHRHGDEIHSHIHAHDLEHKHQHDDV